MHGPKWLARISASRQSYVSFHKSHLSEYDVLPDVPGTCFFRTHCRTAVLHHAVFEFVMTCLSVWGLLVPLTVSSSTTRIYSSIGGYQRLFRTYKLFRWFWITKKIGPGTTGQDWHLPVLSGPRVFISKYVSHGWYAIYVLAATCFHMTC